MSPAPNLADRLAQALGQETGLSWAILFGSAARGGAYRDIDVALMPEPGTYPSSVDLGQLASRLHGALGGQPPVDVVDLRDAALPFLATILTEGTVVLDRRPMERRLWAARVMLDWLDFQPLWERYSQLRRQALRR